MIINKFKKFTTIFNRVINRNKNILKAKGYNNSTLNKVMVSLEDSLNNKLDQNEISSIQACEKYRNELLNNETIITYEVFKSDHTNIVKNICKKAASPSEWCKFLYKMTKNLAPKNVIEIGTNLGVSGCYILEAQKNITHSKLVTMEGLPQLCEIAGAQFQNHKSAEHFEIIQGLYEKTFPEVIKQPIQFDLAFIDGNHQEKPTMEYFQALKSKANNPAVFIFDDIYWSQGMESVWAAIKKDPDVTYSIDLYKQGIVIIDKESKDKNVNFDLFYRT